MSVLVRNLSKSYGLQKALDNVSFEAKKGRILGLLGPNGAGKSTAMKIISGYLRADEGSVSVGEYNINDHAFEIKNILGYLPENNPLYLDLYIVEYLLFICRIHKLEKPHKAIRETIELVGLKDVKSKKIHQLSKGYRQRVGLAQALIHKPEVLILDEPSAGLDPNQLTEIRALIKRIGKEKTVILSTHIMQEVQAICDDLVILNKANVVGRDSLANLTQQLNNQFIRVTFEKVPDLDELRKIGTVTDVKKEGETVIDIYHQNEADVRKIIFDFAMNSNNRILEMSKNEKSMEEIFKELTIQS